VVAATTELPTALRHEVFDERLRTSSTGIETTPTTDDFHEEVLLQIQCICAGKHASQLPGLDAGETDGEWHD